MRNTFRESLLEGLKVECPRTTAKTTCLRSPSQYWLNNSSSAQIPATTTALLHSWGSRCGTTGLPATCTVQLLVVVPEWMLVNLFYIWFLFSFKLGHPSWTIQEPPDVFRISRSWRGARGRQDIVLRHRSTFWASAGFWLVPIHTDF